MSAGAEPDFLMHNRVYFDGNPTSLIILTPLLLPVLARYGIDLVHFGVVFQLNIMIGLLTPPVGMLLYVIMGVSGVEMHEILKDLWPFFIALVLALLLITFIPAITLFLPGLTA